MLLPPNPILEIMKPKQIPTMRVPAWGTLPPELRLMILEALTQLPRGWAAHASVCKEWQAVLEKDTFRRLKLRVSCLDDMESMISPQRSRLVRHVWLNIELRPYTCRNCHLTESYSWWCANNAVIRSAVRKLFHILSRWPSADGAGLTLELSAQSPSDKEHYFKNLYFGGHGEDEDFEPDDRLVRHSPLSENLTEYLQHDIKHGWVNGRQVFAPDASAILRIFSEIDLNFREELPRVKAVTRFAIRRQCRRQFSPRTLGYLFDRLPRLRSLVYEPWQWYKRAPTYHYDNEYEKLIESHLPQSLKHLSLFEETNERYIALIREGFLPHGFGPDSIRVASPAVGAALAERSLSLETLSATFIVEARDFFQSCRPDWVWEDLTSLVLTSRMLTSAASHEDVTELLRSAAAAALSMPRLHTMVLWNGIRGTACKFSYRADSGRASIGWRGTWDLGLEDEVIHAWGEVAHKRTGLDLGVIHEPRIVESVDCHVHAIALLGLPCGVVDPISLLQMQREAVSSWREGWT
ncbi:hypothetical protein CH35J_008962 [Colletotrichum higginsianum]|uniref:DUF6546 domain-containing protein n=1 Tax=Colletotrichum higginsianum TaxID=80884 RepID=A0A4T0VTI3_9PEZI|nr:hypothetical protein CH35J_008962 [Colletotrichum higginsianum]